MQAQTVTPAREPSTPTHEKGHDTLKQATSDTSLHLYELLKSTKVEQLTQEHQVVVLDKNESILSALKKLLEVGIVSAPVVQPLPQQQQEKEEKNIHFEKEGIGLVDTLDIMAYIVELFTNPEKFMNHHNLFPNSTTSGTMTTTTTVPPLQHHNRLQVGSHHQHHLSTMTIEHIVAESAHNPYVPIPLGTSLYDAIRHMIRVKAHRCPIVDPNRNGKMVNVLTQASIVQFLCHHMDAMSKLSREHVGSLSLGTRPVITVPKNMRAIDAFKVMHEHRISGLGVIDPSGILIGNLSARDLKHLDTNNIHSCMYASASSFIQRVRANLINIVHPAISCTDDTELGFVIGRLTTNRIHRLYICDRELKPIGVISLRDVLSCIMNRIDQDLIVRERLNEEETKISKAVHAHEQQEQQESSSSNHSK